MNLFQRMLLAVVFPFRYVLKMLHDDFLASYSVMKQCVLRWKHYASKNILFCVFIIIPTAVLSIVGLGAVGFGLLYAPDPYPVILIPFILITVWLCLIAFSIRRCPYSVKKEALVDGRPFRKAYKIAAFLLIFGIGLIPGFLVVPVFFLDAQAFVPLGFLSILYLIPIIWIYLFASTLLGIFTTLTGLCVLSRQRDPAWQRKFLILTLKVFISIGLLCIALDALSQWRPFKGSEPSFPCLSLEQVTNQHSPAELYPSAIECLAENRVEEARFLYELAARYVWFDEKRLTDRDRARAVQSKWSSWRHKTETLKQKKRYDDSYRRIYDDREGNYAALHRMCEAEKRIGMPTYYPHYMFAPLPPPEYSHIRYAPLENVKVLSDAEMQLLYDIEYTDVLKPLSSCSKREDRIKSKY